MANPRIYEAVQELLNATTDTTQSNIDNWLKTLRSISNKHGIPTDLVINLLKFLLHTDIISSDEKIDLIQNTLIPDDYLSTDIFHLIINQLGTTKNNYLDKSVQCALCQWLINVYFLFPERIPNFDKSTLIYLWKYDYLQKYITYFLVWSTQSKDDIKLWKLNLLLKTTKNPAYSNAEINLLLILKRFYTVMVTSDRLSDIIDTLTTSENNNLLKKLQVLHFDKEFIHKLTVILSRESPNKFGKEIIDSNMKLLIDMLNDSHDDPNKLKYDQRKLPTKSSPLYDINTLSLLSKKWTGLTLPLNVEPLFYTDHTNPIVQFYPMEIINEGNSEQHPDLKNFEISLKWWVEIYLKRCFTDLTLHEEERYQLLNNILFNCQIFEILQTTIINSFLSLENLLANEKIFITLIMSLFPILKPSSITLDQFRNKLLKFLAISHLTYNDKRNKNENSKVFPIMCMSLLEMIRNWFKNYPQDQNITDFGFIMMTDIKKLLLANMRHSIDDRYISVSIIMLVENLTGIIPHIEKMSMGDILQFDKLVLDNETIHKMILFDDPLVLNTCVKYIRRMTDILAKQASASNLIDYQNQNILDITNYLWRNRVLDKKLIFNVPTDFIKKILDNCFFPDVDNKNKLVFSITGIPSMSFISIVALKRLEKKNNVEVEYKNLLTKEEFATFYKYIHNENIKWIPNVNSLASLNIAILKEIYSMEPYYEVPKFLFTFLKSLSKYNDKNE